MPKRTDITSVLILGAGPIVIGQACEFDYAGAQACKALREEGYRVILVNSNPATIMTDPDMAEATYIEPIHWKVVSKIIEKERPDAILPTMGGQTALNCALELEEHGVLAEFGVVMIGADTEVIRKAEDRQRFAQAMQKIGIDTARSGIARTVGEAFEIAENVGFPCIIRPSFTMGGSGGGIAYNREEFEAICLGGFALSTSLLIDESLLGWKEYEMEVVRDKNGNGIIVCSIENLDAMGVHTGDSITVAPAQTLSDKEYQIMRKASLAVLHEIGLEMGGANVQFAINPDNGRLVVIEMNPRVSRSSALASKATGYPIAKIAAKLAVGYTLDELTNDVTGGKIPASFEPTIDYVVTKIPRFNFEKFVGANDRLTTQMKSVGEVMSIGRTFQSSLQKALRSLEIGVNGLEPQVDLNDLQALTCIRHELQEPGAMRIAYLADAFRAGMTMEEIASLTKIDPWFLVQIEDLIQTENQLKVEDFNQLDEQRLRQLKEKGFSDARLATLAGIREEDVRQRREKLAIHPVYKRVDSCAGEFSANSAFLYSTWEEECESYPNPGREKIIILGGGPNRIGQGIEFDYCCVHAAQALREENYETIMVNCNPETVSTDYDTADRLYFEPVTLEDILEISRIEKPTGVIVQYGGQTPLKLARQLEAAGVPIIGTSPDAIDRSENRERFRQVVEELGLKQPGNAIVTTQEQALAAAEAISYPLMLRPSYVLGGRAMEVAYDSHELEHYFHRAAFVSGDAPVLLDYFLDHAIEVDVDAVCDGEHVLIGGILEQIEQAGVHSGDSTCSLPPYTLSQEIQETLRQQTQKLAFALEVRGLMNVQFAVKDDVVYLLEVNPRAARTVPFVSKATGVPLAKVAARVMVGKSLAKQGMKKEITLSHCAVKGVVFPFNKFWGVDPLPGPEMKSTGEAMGIGETFSDAFSKMLLGTFSEVKKAGRVLLSVRDEDKKRVCELAAILLTLGFQLDATRGTALALSEAGIQARYVNKIHEGRPHIVDLVTNGEYSYIVNTTAGRQATTDSRVIRSSALQYGVHYDTSLNSGFATLLSLNSDPCARVMSLQEIHRA